MEIKNLRKPLQTHEIDFRVQSINKGGYATILAYKDARVDINRLDEVCTPLGWKREHTRDNMNCIVSIWCDAKKQWVSKEDTGTESNTEKQKGLASDSFKRACFNWGIGIELYDYPVIQIKLNDDEFDKTSGKPTWNFKLKEWVWISQFTDNKLTHLECKDNKGNLRYRFEIKTISKTPVSKPKLSDEGYTYLMTKGSKEDIKTALNEREITTEQRKQLTSKI